MKDEVLKIMNRPGNMWDDIAEELQRLMCYREVRAYFIAYDELQRQLSWEELEQEALGIFLGDHPESMILEAIEKVKKEQK